MENLNKFIGVECTIDDVLCMSSKEWDALDAVKQKTARNVHSKHPIVILGISKRTEHFNAEVWFKFLDDSHPNFNEGDSDSLEIAKFFDRAEFTLDEKTGTLI